MLHSLMMSLDTQIYFMHFKSEIFIKFKDFEAFVENKIDYKISVLRSNKGGEYFSREFKKLYKHACIVWQNTTLYASEQNGVAKWVS